MKILHAGNLHIDASELKHIELKRFIDKATFEMSCVVESTRHLSCLASFRGLVTNAEIKKEKKRKRRSLQCHKMFLALVPNFATPSRLAEMLGQRAPGPGSTPATAESGAS
ncbi:hypothetical protein HYFRA_00008486 [Hymenoscyphus fraxineus]|uniref:Uncharacterized protein n=1 Tax=Hymenoscyphus fraxineus TaxID=746836 RepID=A0A9N9KP81_9HELO|nr:hypothetical protein HYFRA_00008486 [Hymenoscyphus fraxineus]